MPTHSKVDVVTIGAGWCGAILAWKLTAAGHRVVSIERGPIRWANPDFAHDHDPLRYDVRHAMMQDLGRETWTWRPNPQAPSLPMRKYGSFNPGQGLGGSTVHWSGMLWRFLETDFKYRTHHVARYGEQKLPQGNRIQDWPISYQELEPYYDEFEYDIGASGQTGNLMGHVLEGGNPFEAPRSRPFPLPPLVTTIGSDLFARACSDLGYHPFPQPAGITSQAYRDRFGNYRSGCLYCGYCTRFGCEVDAKTSPQTTYLPPAIRTGRYEVRPNSTVTKINIGSDGMATGITYIDAHGTEHVQPADLVLVTGFTLSNTRLLLLSRGSRHQNGIGNDRGLVGKNYTYQNWHDAAKGVIAGQKLNLYMGNTATINVIYDFNGDTFDHSSLDFVGGASIFGVLGENHPLASAQDFPILPSGGGGGESGTGHAGQPASNGPPKGWGQSWKEALRRDWDSVATLTIEGESLPYEDQFLDLDPVYKDNFGLPLLRLTFDWHDNDKKMVRFIFGKCNEIMQRMGANPISAKSELGSYEIHTYQSTHPTGGTIFGTDPGNSVCNKYGQVWDTPNVFVVGASLYPQNPGANPTGTLGPLAYMIGDAIRDKYMRHTGHLIT